MTDALINYEKNLTSVENLLVIHDALLVDEDFEKEKLTDLLRSAIVLIVSSYDNFVHDFYREKIVLNYFDDTSDEIKLNKMHLSLDSMRKIGAVINIEEKKAILSRELRLIQKTDSFQSPKSLEYIFTNLGIKNIWQKLSEEGVKDLAGNTIKSELANVIDRRNKIAHESDWDFINNRKYLINRSDIEYVKSFFNDLVNAINNI